MFTLYTACADSRNVKSLYGYLPTLVLSNITKLSDTADAVKNVLPVVNYEVRTIQTTNENISVWTLSDHSESLLHALCFKNTVTYLFSYVLRAYCGKTWMVLSRQWIERNAK